MNSFRRSRKVPVLFASVLVIFLTTGRFLGQANGPDQTAQTLDRDVFASPPHTLGPIARWWWPGGDVDDQELMRELTMMRQAGFSGAEIQSFAVGLPLGASPAVFDYGSAEWLDHLGAAITSAINLGLTIDLTLGSSWPSGGDDVQDADSLQQLTVTGQLVHGPTLLDQLPPPPTEPPSYAMAEALLGLPNTFQPEKMSPVAVIAAQLDPNQTAEQLPPGPTLPDLPDLPPTVYIDPASVVYLSDRFDPNGRLQWDVPDGDWLLFTFFAGPTGSRPLYSAEPDGGRVLDHLSREATERYLNGLTEELVERFWNPGAMPLRSLFIDSLELRTEDFWTEDFLSEFYSRRGYRLEPFLPVLNRPFQADAYLHNVYPEAPPGFEMRVIGPRVRYDYDRTVSDLVNERFFETVRNWAESNDLALRAQAHGGPAELLSAYGRSSIPETEGLFAGGHPAFLKIASSAAHLFDKPLVGSEVFAFRLPDQSTSMPAMLREVNKHVAAGVNLLVFHGYPYAYTAGFGPSGWMPFDSPYLPGKSLIGTFGTRLNETNPFWRFLPTLNEYVARAQYVARAGRSIADVALYTGGMAYPDDPTLDPELNRVLQMSGYEYDYVNDFVLSDASVEEKALVVGTNRYKALIVAGVQRMTLELAENISRFVAAGLPVVFVDEIPGATPGYLDFQTKDLLLQATLEGMFEASLESVRNAGELVLGSVAFSEEATGVVPLLIENMQVEPELLFDEGIPDLHYSHRRAGTADYYFLFHAGNEPLDTQISFPNSSRRIPEIWSLETGRVESAIVYRHEAPRTKVQVHFEPGSAVVLGFEKVGYAPHLEATELNAVRRDSNGNLVGIASFPGSYSVMYGGGILDQAVVSGKSLPPIGLAVWDIAVAEVDEYGQPSIANFPKSELTDLAELLDPSFTFTGTARYSAFIDIQGADPEYLSPDVGVILDLGRLHDVAEVRVNGAEVDTLVWSPYEVEITSYLARGLNEIEVLVTTVPEQSPSGLLGPVHLVPIYKTIMSPPPPLQFSVGVVPANFPENTNEDMLAAILRASMLVDHVNFQWFWKTPPNDANPEGGAVVDCSHVATWVAEARRLDLGVTLQFQTFYTQVEGDYALGPIAPDRKPITQVASPIMPFETGTFAEPALADAFMEQIGCLASLQPDYLVLGPEINFLVAFKRDEWRHFLPVYRDAYHLVKTVSPATRVGLSYQYDGMLRDHILSGDRWPYIAEVGPADFVALTSYYGFSEERFLEFPEPYSIPEDYYHPIRAVMGDHVPIIFSEVGWSSFFESGETTQAEFVKRLPLLLRDVHPDHVVWALLHDVAYFEGPGQSLNQSGLLDAEGGAKPAWDASMNLKDEGIFLGVVPSPPPSLPFSVTVVPPDYPTLPVTIERGAAAIELASEITGHVGFQFAWRDYYTGQQWGCEDIRPFMEEARLRGLGTTIQFNSYTPVLNPDDPDADPILVLSNPIVPPPPDIFSNPENLASLSDPAIRDAYLEELGCIASLEPDYLVLGPEVNFLAIFRYEEFQVFTEIFKEAYQLVKSVSHGTQVGISVQYDVLRRELLEGSTASWIQDFGAQDFVGMTTYFATSDELYETYPHPLDVPADYYAPIRDLLGPGKPVVFTEVAWSTHFADGENAQVGFLNRLPALLESVGPENVIWGMQHDILDYYPGEITPLNQIGLRYLDGTPKPAWLQILELRRLHIYRSP